jgi:hypothetical protein
MADKKISALTSASTPLAGTEVLPIVQSGTTVKVAVSEVVKAVGQASSGTGTPAAGVVHTFQESASLSAAQKLVNRNSTQAWHVAVDAAAVDDGLYALINPATGQVVYTLAPLGDATLKLGNLVQGTAAKGFNFSANTPLAGKTSTLLNWYEEGTYTPVQNGMVVVGVVTLTGSYTRIGRQVFYSIKIASTGTTTSTLGAVTITLPFTKSSTTLEFGQVVIAGVTQGMIEADPGLYFYPCSWPATATVYASGSYTI